ncbi:hypothetical protein KWG61_07825 [Allobaculum sp. Allo2]|nr:hypothetical protein KWG61_07825 [Allobaculum sp. Allo2]
MLSAIQKITEVISLHLCMSGSGFPRENFIPVKSIDTFSYESVKKLLENPENSKPFKNPRVRRLFRRGLPSDPNESMPKTEQLEFSAARHAVSVKFWKDLDQA